MRNSTVEQQLIECGWKDRRGLDYLKIAVKNFSRLNLHLVSLFFSRIAATHVFTGLHRLCYHTIQKITHLPSPSAQCFYFEIVRFLQNNHLT